ncbi:MAG: phage virion morphogenesis protein [Treponematales bacterium]
MAGAGIEVRLDAEYQNILDALEKASSPDLQAIAGFAGEELYKITMKAFDDEADPATGAKWEALKRPRANGKTRPILHDRGQLRRSLNHNWQAFPDGSVIFGSNMVYARIHQMGGDAGRGRKSHITARPYLGVTRDFDRRILGDPAVLRLLGLEA